MARSHESSTRRGRLGQFPLEPGWRPLLEDLSVHPGDLLRRARLPEDLFSRAEVGLSTEEYFRFWTSLEAEVGDPVFPLRIAEVVTTESFLPPLFAALCSPNLIVAAQRISRYKRLIAPMALHVTERRAGLELAFEWLDASVAPPQSLVAAELAFIVRLARIATREQVEVVRGKIHALTFAKVDAERPFLTANEAMWKVFEPSLRLRLAELDDSASVSERVRATLLESLPSGKASMDAVAGRLALSKRTLQRRLSEEGTSFQIVLNRTREDLARHYLSRTAYSCAEISFLLGFEDPNSFFRAFHEWTGDTPESLRQASMH